MLRQVAPLLFAITIAGCGAAPKPRLPTPPAVPIITEVQLPWPAVAIATLVGGSPTPGVQLVTSNEHAAALWLAADQASLATGMPLHGNRITIKSTEQFDGFASNAAVAVALMATTQHVALRANTTVIGLVAPDGTLAPVANVESALTAALAAKVNRIGVPASLDPATLKRLQVLALPSKASVDMLDNLAAAYHFSTGVEAPLDIPHATALPAAALELDATTVVLLQSSYQSRKQRALAAWSPVVTIMATGRVPVPLLALAAQTRRDVERAEQKFAQRDYAGAQWLMCNAAWQAATVDAAYQVLQHMRAGNGAAAATVLRELTAHSADALAGLRNIASRATATHDDLLRMYAGFSDTSIAWAAQVDARNRVDVAQRTLLELAAAPSTAATANRFDDAVIAATLPVLAATLHASAMTDDAATSATARPSIGSAVTYDRAVLATIVDDNRTITRATQPELAPSQLQALERIPLLSATELPQLAAPAELAIATLPSTMFELARTRAAVTATAGAFTMLALGLPGDAGASLSHMAQMARLAQRAALQHLTAMQRFGTIPTAAKLAYAQGLSQLADGTTASLAAALTSFWRVAELADTSRLLTSAVAVPVATSKQR